MSLRRVKLSEFKQHHIGGAPEGVSLLVPKQYAAEDVKVIDEAERILEFTISTAAVDRDQDTVSIDGWKLDNYRKNPVVLWAHDHSIPAIGQSMVTWAENGKLKSRNKYPSREEYEFGNLIYRLHKGGFIRSVSVGFIPLKWAANEERPSHGWGPAVDFLEQELIEHSSCNVPANPEALMGASAKGIDLGPMLSWYSKALDENALLLERDDLEAGYKAIAKSCGKGASVVVPDAIAKNKPEATEPETVAESKPEPTPAAEETSPAATPAAADPVADVARAIDALVKFLAAASTESKSTEKHGRVLSAANEDRLKRANALLDEVLAQLDTAPDDDKSAAPAAKAPRNDALIITDAAGKAVLHLEKESLDALLAMVREQVSEAIRNAQGALD